jgi:phage repressor protein C with HTH and peptisase S24 domain
LADTSNRETLIFRKNLGARIASCVDKIGKKSDAAAASGISPEQLNKWIAGTVKVPAEALRLLAKVADVDFSWLVTGDGQSPHRRPIQIRNATNSQTRESADGAFQILGEQGFSQAQTSGAHIVQPVSNGSEIAEVSEDEASSESFVALPFYSEVAASAGPGKTAPSEYSDSVIAFTRDFLDGLGANPDQCSVIRASGDSMHPSIPDGSLLTVDHSQTEVRNGHIMVISLGDDLLVKRIRRRLDGLVDLISDNNAYPPETIGRDMISQLRVVGRVVYFCRVP